MTDTSSYLENRVSSLEREVGHLRRVQECTAALISSLDFDETLNIILTTARDVVGAEQGSILLYDTERTHLTIAYAVGLTEETIRETRVPDGEGITGRVARSGEPILVEDIDADTRFEERRSDPERSRSFACLPLVYQGRTLGVMNLSHPSGILPFNQKSLPLLVALANQAAVAIAHSEMHRSLLEKERLDQQIETARSIQESFISPKIHIRNGEFHFVGRNAAARSVGGDLYDVLDVGGGQTAVFLGDVSGKGIPAALFMARLFSDVHHFIGSDPRPEAVLTALNNSLCKRRHRGMFVTMAYGLVSPKEQKARVCIAGHPSPIVRKRDGSVISLPPPKSPPLGLLQGISYASFDVNLRQGDLMLFYTDGVNEATNTSGEQFGTDRLEQSLVEAGSGPEAIDHLFGCLNDFTRGRPARDDITLLAASRT